MQEEPSLVLASTSAYRRELLSRWRVPFACQAPGVDEAELPGESAQATCERLALAKAQAVASQHPKAWVIGSDQVAVIEGRSVSKPLTHDNAVAQLRAMRGRTIDFHTAVAVVRTDRSLRLQETVTARVRFRNLSDAHIERYLRLEQPYDCAGSAKSEALGIALLEAIDSSDPTALVGLPLITLAKLLRQADYEPLDHAR